MNVIHSVLPYGVEIWVDALKVGKFRTRIASVQRSGALRITNALRTVSEAAAMVVDGVIPIDLLAEEKKRTHARKAEGDLKNAWAEGRKRILSKWQQRWYDCDEGRWTNKSFLKPLTGI